MASAIETHPQKQRIIAALTAGESVRAIAAWTNPPLHYTSIARYARHIVAPALRKHGEIVKTLKENEILRQTIQDSGSTKEIERATCEVIAADPIIAALEEKRLRHLRIVAKAEDSENYSACAALEAADTRALTLRAQIEGKLQAATGSTTVAVAVYAPQIHVHQQPEPTNVIDADVCEITR